MSKRRISVVLDEETVEELERIREETGVPVSQQIEMCIKGYEIHKRGEQQVSESGEVGLP